MKEEEKERGSYEPFVSFVLTCFLRSNEFPNAVTSFSVLAQCDPFSVSSTIRGCFPELHFFPSCMDCRTLPVGQRVPLRFFSRRSVDSSVQRDTASIPT